MKDAVVGIAGAVLVLVSMSAVFGLQQGPADEPAASVATNHWSAEGCTGMSLVWTPPLDSLQEIIGPNWQPGPGPLPGGGFFVLFAATCDDSLLDGVATGPVSLAASLVRLVEPEDPRNVTVPDGWSAVPDWIGQANASVLEMVARRGFVVADGSASVTVDEGPLGAQVTMVVETADGRIDATALVGGQAQGREVDGALVGTDPALFSLFTGPETMQRRNTGTAIVQATGTTWVSRLALEARPFGIALDADFGWDFTFSSEPWS